MEKRELPWRAILLRGLLTGGVFSMDLLIDYIRMTEHSASVGFRTFCGFPLFFLTVALAVLVLTFRGDRYWWCSYLLGVLILLSTRLYVSPAHYSSYDYVDPFVYYVDAFITSLFPLFPTLVTAAFVRSWQED